MSMSKLKTIGLSMVAVCILVIIFIFMWEPCTERVTPSEPSGIEGDYGYVDLGLSVKWATYNVGAQDPSQCGNYYAWGSDSGDAYIIGDLGGSECDPAHAERGGNWRTPTAEECKELIEKCTWIWGIYDGQKGCKVIGPNGKSIFLPAGGYPYSNRMYYMGKHGYYWSSTPNNSDVEYAFGFDFTETEQSQESDLRRRNRSIRPVLGDEIPTIKYEVGDYYNVEDYWTSTERQDEVGWTEAWVVHEHKYDAINGARLALVSNNAYYVRAVSLF